MKTERNILVTYHSRKARNWTRRFVRLNTAMRRASELALAAKPWDVFELSHSLTGLQIGTIKVGVNSLRATWIWS